MTRQNKMIMQRMFRVVQSIRAKPEDAKQFRQLGKLTGKDEHSPSGKVLHSVINSNLAKQYKIPYDQFYGIFIMDGKVYDNKSHSVIIRNALNGTMTYDQLYSAVKKLVKP